MEQAQIDEAIALEEKAHDLVQGEDFEGASKVLYQLLDTYHDLPPEIVKDLGWNLGTTLIAAGHVDQGIETLVHYGYAAEDYAELLEQ